MTPAQYLEQLQAGEAITEITVYNQNDGQGYTDEELAPLLAFLNDPLNAAAAQRLTHLNLGCNKLTRIDLSAFANLEVLELRYNNFESITIANKPFLVQLGLDSCSKLIDITLQDLPMLERLNISCTQRPYLDVSHLPSLSRIFRLGSPSRVDRMASRDAQQIEAYRPKFWWGGIIGGANITLDDLVPPVFTTQILDGHFTPFFEGRYYQNLVRFNLDRNVMPFDFPLILSPDELNKYCKYIALALEKMPSSIVLKVGEFLISPPYRELARESMTFLKQLYSMQTEAEQPNSQLAILTKYEDSKFRHLENYGIKMLNSYDNMLAKRKEKSRYSRYAGIMRQYLTTIGNMAHENKGTLVSGAGLGCAFAIDCYRKANSLTNG